MYYLASGYFLVTFVVMRASDVCLNLSSVFMPPSWPCQYWKREFFFNPSVVLPSWIKELIKIMMLMSDWRRPVPHYLFFNPKSWAFPVHSSSWQHLIKSGWSEFAGVTMRVGGQRWVVSSGRGVGRWVGKVNGWRCLNESEADKRRRRERGSVCVLGEWEREMQEDCATRAS